MLFVRMRDASVGTRPFSPVSVHQNEGTNVRELSGLRPDIALLLCCKYRNRGYEKLAEEMNESKGAKVESTYTLGIHDQRCYKRCFPHSAPRTS